MKTKLISVLMCLAISLVYSQNVTISGTVTDASVNQPLPGVNILVKGTVKGTTTDFDGNYTITDISINSVLEFSYVGFVTQEIKVNNSKKINVILQEDAQSLNEVVVIGYGSQKKRDITGSVSLVSSETIDKIKPIKVEQALQGTVSGVNVSTQSGAPGAGFNINIRGVGTNGVSGPTVIIDGYVGDLGVLNPSDIETITVLKDAQAGIYGTIGANGIILITTKSGKKNTAPRVSVNSYVGFQETTRKLPTLNATEYALLLNESYAAAGQTLPFPNVSGLGVGTNWQDEVFQNSIPLINHDFTVSGGSEKVTYAISGSHLYQQGIIAPKKTDFRRNTARVALGIELSDKLKIDINAIYTYIDRDAINDNGLGSVLFNGLNAPPTLSPFDENGDFSLIPSTTGLGIEIINPLAQINNTFNDYDLKKLNGTATLEYKIIENLKLTGRIGFNTSNSEGKTFAKQVDYGGKVFDVPRSSVSQNAINDNDYSLDLFGTYTNSFTDDHNVVLTLGTTVYKQFGNGLFATGFDVPNNDWAFADISLATGTSEGRDVSSYAYDERRLSFFGRFQYDFKGKYFLSAMLRRDSSTRFGPENRVAYFPTATAGVVIYEEAYKEDPDFVNFIKLRGSYGILGNDQIGNNRYVSLLSGEATYVFDGQLVNGQAPGVLPNPELKWEEGTKKDLGIDLKLFDSKIDITADYFENTRDQLLIENISVSGITGTSAPGGGSPTVNAGSVRNKGFEFAINYKDQISQNFNFSLNYNFTTIDNKVLAVNNSTGFLEGGSFGVGQLPPSRMEAGFPIGYFYGYQTDGIFQNQAEVAAHPSQIALGANAAPGDIRYADLNGDGVINTSDRTNLGDPIPDITMGFSLNLDYKGFDFSAYTFASIGNDMVRNYERTLSDANRSNYILNRWTGEGTSNTVPRVTTAATANNVFSNYFIEDASYVRIQNIQLGYTIPLPVTEKMGISKVRIYAGVNNLYTFTEYRGYDPGASTGAPVGSGIDNGFYPIPRTYLMGLNLNF